MDSHETHFLRFSRIAVFLVSLLVIVGIVALSQQAPAVQPVRAAPSIAMEEQRANLAGAAYGIAGAAYAYTGYDVYNRVVLLTKKTSAISVAVDAKGDGAIVCGGKSFPVRVTAVDAKEPLLLVDLDGDGYLDQKFRQGERFLLACDR